MPLTPSEESRTELQIATFRLISAVEREEQTLQTRKPNSEEQARLHADVEQAYRHRDQVVAKLNAMPDW
jgi:hypothetical protein